MIRNTILLLLIGMMCTSMILAKEARYHRVVAQQGDYTYLLLKRYQLDKHQCNFDEFYKLNKLTRQSELKANQKYYIPVLIYDYNGVSIRSTLDIEDWKQAVRIKKYNEKMKADKLRRSTIVSSNILWVPYHELSCEGGGTKPTIVEKPSVETKTESKTTTAKVDKETAKKEAEARRKKLKKIDPKVLVKSKRISGHRKYAIFGKENAHVPLKDNKLRGKIYYIVSGHGGPDVGAVGSTGSHRLCEDEYAYDVSLRLARNLLEHGALVYMITRDPNDGIRSGSYLKCDYDEYCWGDFKIPRSQKVRLYQRSDAINRLFEEHKARGVKESDQITIAIHIDSRGQSENTDVFYYYYPGSHKGKAIARNIQKVFSKKYKKYRKGGRYSGTVTSRDLHMLREPNTTSVFVELGNIRNPFDQQRFILENNRQALANWLYEGLIKN